MQTGVEQVQHKISRVPSPDAGAHPGAVVIVNLDTEAAYTTVERAWRAQYLTCVAVRELLVVCFQLFCEDAPVLLVHRVDLLLRQQFESIGAEERLDSRHACPCATLFLEIAHDFLWCLVGDAVLFVVVDLFRPKLGDDPRLCA